MWFPVLAGAGLLVALGYSADKAGEGLNDAGTGALKFAIVTSLGYLIYRKVAK